MFNLIGNFYIKNNIKSKYPLYKLKDLFYEIKNGVDVFQQEEKGKYFVSRINSILSGNFDIHKTKYTNDEVNKNDFLQYEDILFSHINSTNHLAKTAIF